MKKVLFYSQLVFLALTTISYADSFGGSRNPIGRALFDCEKGFHDVILKCDANISGYTRSLYFSYLADKVRTRNGCSYRLAIGGKVVAGGEGRLSRPRLVNVTNGDLGLIFNLANALVFKPIKGGVSKKHPDYNVTGTFDGKNIKGTCINLTFNK